MKIRGGLDNKGLDENKEEDMTMSVCLIGLDPIEKEGRELNLSSWWWRPLLTYCEEVASAIIHKVSVSYGEGSKEDAVKLAAVLKKEIEEGNTLLYEKEYKSRIDSLPLEKCNLCEGTGFRWFPTSTGAGETPCLGCESKGMRKSRVTFYCFEVSCVQEFVNFLERSGGFRIQ